MFLTHRFFFLFFSRFFLNLILYQAAASRAEAALVDEYGNPLAAAAADSYDHLGRHAAVSAGTEAANFALDGCLAADVSEAEVYERCAQPVVARAMQARAMGCVMAYGQTRSGKTHTMLGTVVPRALEEMFAVGWVVVVAVFFFFFFLWNEMSVFFIYIYIYFFFLKKYILGSETVICCCCGFICLL
jgi:hypothetical protein